jgi:transmembrane sensor
LNDHVEDKPARHVAVDVSEARVDRLWGRVQARLGRPRPVRSWIFAGAATALAAAAVVIAVRTGRGPSLDVGGDVASSAWEGASLETGADALAVKLVDGSQLKLDPASRVEVGDRTPSVVKLVLKRGRIGCDVTHRPGRSFVVMADGVEVRVVGTRFSVATEHGNDSARVEVRVERGVVEVRGPGANAEVVRVEAGRSWSQVTSTKDLVEPAAEDTADGEMPEMMPPPVASDRRAGAAPARGAARSHSPARPTHVTGPRELFEQARGQWRRGHIQQAADTYQALLNDFPRDGRAGLAAFELGRLRMDRLGDMRGAVQALERAVALAPGSEFREDAMARLVAAHAGAHDRAGCVRARDQYLTEFPSGVHHRTVAAACK